MKITQHKSLRRRESGYMLLVLMVAVAVLTITMLQVAIEYRRSIQRDREVEMIHRGEQYARAVKRYYKKFGRYPTTIEQLENTNKVRFLRKRYKDPMSPDGQWKIAHATDVKLPGIGAGNLGGAAGGAGSNALGTSTNASAFGSALNATNTSTGASNVLGTGQSSDGTVMGTTSGSSSSGTGTDSSAGGTIGTGNSQDTSSNASTGPTGTGNATNQVLGGGDMLGVVSKSKAEGIHSFGDKRKYNEWFFIYVPTQDIGNALITGPYNPKMFIGSANSGLNNSNKSGTSTGSTSPTSTTPSSSTGIQSTMPTSNP